MLGTLSFFSRSLRPAPTVLLPVLIFFAFHCSVVQFLSLFGQSLQLTLPERFNPPWSSLWYPSTICKESVPPSCIAIPVSSAYCSISSFSMISGSSFSVALQFFFSSLQCFTDILLFSGSLYSCRVSSEVTIGLSRRHLENEQFLYLDPS